MRVIDYNSNLLSFFLQVSFCSRLQNVLCSRRPNPRLRSLSAHHEGKPEPKLWPCGAMGKHEQ